MSDIGPDTSQDRQGEELNELLSRIEALGIPYTLRDQIRARLIVMRMVAARGQRMAGDALARVISPLFARSGAEQAGIRALAGHMDPANEAPARADVDMEPASPRHLPRRTVRLTLALVTITAGLVILGWLVYQSIPAQENERSDPSPTFNRSIGLPDFMRTVEVPELPQPPWPYDRTKRWYYTEFTPAKILAVLLPFVAVGAVLWVLWQRLADYLRRRNALRQFALERLRLKAHDITLVDRRSVALAVQRIRRRPDPSASYVDVERTVQRSAEQAGFPHIVEQVRPSSAPHLILVEKRARHDHMAAVFELLLSAVLDAGLHGEIWEFSGDPRHLRGPGGRREGLEELLRARPDWRLVLLTDGRCFVDPVSGRVAPWALPLRRAEARMLLTPRPGWLWGNLERTLERGLGLRIEEATTDGINRLGTAPRPQAELPIAAAPTAAVRQLDMLFETRPLLWTSRVRPARSSVEELIAALQEGLDAQAMRWLRALAVYPALRFEVSVRLGELIRAGETPEELRRRLFALSRLPWLREGHMPDWLRQRLLSDMSREENTQVRNILGAGEDGRRGGRLELIRPDNTAPVRPERDGILLDFLFGFRRLRGLRVNYHTRLRELLMLRRVRQFLAASLAGIFVACAGAVLALSLVPLHPCDALGAHVYDPYRLGAGVDRRAIVLRPEARAACEQAVGRDRHNARWQYQLALLNSGPEGTKAYENTMRKPAEMEYPSAIARLAIAKWEANGEMSAEPYLRKLEQLDPNLATIWRALGEYHYNSDKAQAVDLFEQAGHHVSSVEFYWALIAQGRIDEAKRFLVEAAKLGNPGALNHLGFLLRVGKDKNGVEIDIDPDLGASYYLEAAGAGYPIAMGNAALVYRNGWTGVRDDDLACAWALRSAFAGNTKGFWYLASWQECGQKIDSFSALQHAALAGFPNAQLRLANNYFFGEGGVKEDHGKAAEFYRMILENDDSEEADKSTARDRLAEISGN